MKNLLLILFMLPTTLFAQVAADYFPLNLGNEWEMRSFPIEGSGWSPRSTTVKIKTTDILLNEQYFQQESRSIWDDGSRTEYNYVWLRSDSAGNILIAAIGDSIDVHYGVIYDPPLMIPNEMFQSLGATVQWEVDVPYSIENEIITFQTVSLSEGIVVPAGEFDQCVVIRQVVTNVAGDTLRSDLKYYAAGVGEVFAERVYPSEEQHWSELIKYSIVPSNLQAHQIPGQIHITWQDNSNTEDGFYLEVKDITNIPMIWDSLSTTGPSVISYQMDKPILGHQYVFRVRAFDYTGHSAWSNEDTLLATNLLEYISITSPQGGEVLKPGETFNINWNTRFPPPVPINFHVTIRYSIDGGSHWVSPAIADSIPDTGSYPWIVPDILTDNCIIKIEDATDGQPYDLSNKPVGIGMSPLAIDVKGDLDIPSDFQLNQNYPNPFNPRTMIAFTLPERQLVTLKIYDVLGREVATLVDGSQESGNYKVPFTAQDLASGIYFIHLKAGKFIATKKMILMK